jgi:hypothetical protein
MSQSNIDQRVEAPEKEVARLSNLKGCDPRISGKYWLTTVGMFADDAVMNEIIDEGRKIRQQDCDVVDDWS